MNMDFGQVNQVIDRLPYPVSKSNLVQMVQQSGIAPQMTAVLDRLPDKTYNTPDELKNDLKSLGNLGNIDNLGGFKL
ncbi:DUF2795 domain-containing protein [Ktedonospora formicarum]|uniref:DUF2795 domain-containing protein n=1 Tax=Ktedonospora formicarum TaxID=2778364 RepID=A0A8J3HYK9_9CHLR|nr:DUF2795 domain-containing protein [Ktedonospora formicarum]GHO42334.1 hypothetical protein KSX_04970 [Ktedonospora formicarum]